ncbi:MAG: gamma-glutamyltransferase family protein [Saccharospirillum sp.]|nr:gamma-glutamyltransferase family protein [Saccharospirillum sp.]
MLRHWVVLLGMSLVLSSCNTETPEAELLAFVPEPKPQQIAHQVKIAAPNDLAADIGLGVLQQGGHAMDAAIAVKAVLGLVEAPETGWGGGGFVLYYDAASKQTRFYDGRETAPLAAQPDRFTLLGRAVPWYTAMPTGRSVGVPGMPALMSDLHSKYGRLAWPDLLAPAIDLAEQGVPMPIRLAAQIEADPSLRLFPDTRDYFRTQAQQEPARLVNQAYADTLRRLAESGGRAFYEPPLSTAVIERASQGRFWPSDLAQADFDQYQMIERDAVCANYRQWRVCGAPPPSSGGITLLQTLGMLEGQDLAALGPDSDLVWHWILEASRLAFADRHRFLGDPDQVSVPVAELIDPQYLSLRAELIRTDRAMTEVPFGDPQSLRASAGYSQPLEGVREGTSHLSLVDTDGNVVLFTSSIEKPFGNRMMTEGFLLNNQLTDFTFNASAEFGAHPNAVAGGKRPRSSMAPILVFDESGELVLALGSRGGSRIIGYVLKTLIAHLDWQMPLEQAVALPNVLYSGQAIEVEANSGAVRRVAGLEALGHSVTVTNLTSGVHGLAREGEGWQGAADPRMTGVSRGFNVQRAEEDGQ